MGTIRFNKETQSTLAKTDPLTSIFAKNPTIS